MSYHIVVDVYTNKAVNKFIATILDSKVGKFKTEVYDSKTDTSKYVMKGIFDLGVYSNNHTLRLPNCIKFENVGKR